jgi:hypothetical protein
MPRSGYEASQKIQRKFQFNWQQMSRECTARWTLSYDKASYQFTTVLAQPHEYFCSTVQTRFLYSFPARIKSHGLYFIILFERRYIFFYFYNIISFSIYLISISIATLHLQALLLIKFIMYINSSN